MKFEKVFVWLVAPVLIILCWVDMGKRRVKEKPDEWYWADDRLMNAGISWRIGGC